MPKLRVGIVFGGRSTEHEVSVTSATTILKGLDPARYAPVLIGVDHEGRWHVAETEHQLAHEQLDVVEERTSAALEDDQQEETLQ